jgi:hypothetical protein
MQAHTILPQPPQKPINYFEQIMLIHKTQQSLNQNSQIPQVIQLQTVEIAQLLEELLYSNTPLLRSYRSIAT